MKGIMIGEKYKEKLEIPILSCGFTPFCLPKNPDLDIRLASHADLSVFIHEKTAILASCLRDENVLVNFLTNRGYTVRISSKPQSSAYPNDVNLCAALIGNRIIHNRKYTDPEILDIGLECINVNQGYARCTSLVVDSKSLITADNGIAAAAKQAGINVLFIDDNGIELPGYDRGFIGGASFKIDNTIYFTGDIDTHPDAKNIKEFINNRGLDICCLCEGALLDIGGAVCLE